MTVANVDFSEDNAVSALLGVTAEEAELIEHRIKQMLEEIKSFQARSRTAEERFDRSSRETRAILNQMMPDLKLK